MNFEIIVVSAVLLFILIFLYKEVLGPAFTFLIAVIVLGIAGILTPKQILHGFSNRVLIEIMLLLLLGDIIRRASVIELVFDRFFKTVKTKWGFLARMMMLISGFSAFLNNTPIVAVMMPYVHNWCKRNNVSPSKLLIPLSYAAILGGCATLIGTSTNLIVNGFVIDHDIKGLPSLNLFDFSIVGGAMMVIGFLYLLFFSDRLLPSKSNAMDQFTSNTRKHVVEAQVKKGSHLIGKTIDEAKLRNLEDLYLIDILRGNYRMKVVNSEVILQEGDILYFVGATETIADLVDSNSGLIFPEVGMLHRKKKTEIVEIVISHNSSLINKTAKEANFRGKYDSAIIAIQRDGESLHGKIGSIQLKAGDAILLFAGIDLTSRSMFTQDFYFISKIKEIKKLEFYKIAILLGGTVLAIAIAALGFTSLFMSLTVLIILLLLLKIANPKDLPKSIDYNLAIIIALSMAIGTAMIESNLAIIIADGFLSAFEPFGSIGLLFGIYIITSLFAAYITNPAAVAIIFPIALSVALNGGYDPKPFVLTVSFAAAANFITPIGYQTNLMVYGPGGYLFKDYLKIGLPLTILYMLTTVSILYFIYFF